MDATFVFVIVFTGAVSLWGMLHRPAPKSPGNKKYEGVKDLVAWHKNVGTRWNG